MKRMAYRYGAGALAVMLLVGAGPGDEVVSLYRDGEYGEALEKAKEVLDDDAENPKIVYYAGMSCEKLGKWKKALKYWQDLDDLAENDKQRGIARRHIALCQPHVRQSSARPHKPTDAPGPKRSTPTWRQDDPALSHVDNTFWSIKTEHFQVRTRNKKLSQIIAERAENYLDRIRQAFMGSMVWPHVTRVTVYRDHPEYVRLSGNPPWSGGGFSLVSADGRFGSMTRKIDLFQLNAKGTFDPGLVTRVLPHELTHVVIEEYMGAGTCPRWLHEGMAMFMEEGTNLEYEWYLQQAVLQGKTYPLRVLCGSRQYLPNVGLFYAQSASVTRMLLTRLTAEQFRNFLLEVKRRHSLDTCLSAATGKGQPGLVGLLEKAWLTVNTKRAKGNPVPKPGTLGSDRHVRAAKAQGAKGGARRRTTR